MKQNVKVMFSEMIAGSVLGRSSGVLQWVVAKQGGQREGSKGANRQVKTGSLRQRKACTGEHTTEVRINR